MACDAARGVSIRLRSRRWEEYEAAFGENDGQYMAFGREATPELILRMGIEHQDALRNQIFGGKISGPTGIPQLLANLGKSCRSERGRV